jgi:dTMP kinase
MTGKLITLEGGEGAGKSTVLETVREMLVARGLDVVVTREPGGTPAGEEIRKVLLDTAHRGLCAEAELLLMFASRAQLVRELVQPALAAGSWVLSDRFTDATFAYQGGGRGLPRDKLETLERWVQGGFEPDLTILFDLPPETASARRGAARSPDKFESETEAFFARTRAEYLRRAQEAPYRFAIVDASQSIERIQAALGELIDAL